MNCKPGQLCRIVNNPLTALAGIVDRFVTVKTVTHNDIKEASWIYEWPLIRTVQGHPAECIPDSWLKPIDNPGDDATDEVIQRIGTPNKEIA